MSFDELRAAYRERKLLIFIGAGVSMSVRPAPGGASYPSWKELVDEAAKQMGFTDPDLLRTRGSDLQILEFFRLRHGGNVSELTNWLVRLMTVDDATLAGAPIYAELAQMTNLSLIYTTNYDDFIERALRLHGKAVEVVAEETDLGYEAADIQVVKFHGDWNTPKRMVLTESDYSARFDFRDIMDRKFLGDLLNRAVLFLGYSFNDPNVAYLFSSLKDRRVKSFITVPDPSEFEYRLFRDRNIEIEPIGRFRETEDIVDILKRMR